MSTPSLKKAKELEQEANRNKALRERSDADDVTITPSQAEGDRETVERDTGDPGDDNFGRQGGGQGQRQPTPSQAEGDRKEIERDIREKDQGGHA